MATAERLTPCANADSMLYLFMRKFNRPRSIYQYSNMDPRLSVQTSLFCDVFFVSKSFRELKDKTNFKHLQFWPESLGSMLEYWYIERGLFRENLWGEVVLTGDYNSHSSLKQIKILAMCCLLQHIKGIQAHWLFVLISIYAFIIAFIVCRNTLFSPVLR